MIAAAATGFVTGFTLILAIGAQNAFVLRQGLARAHVFWLCLLCSVSDAILIAAGVAGIAALVQSVPELPRFIAGAGAAFLFVYGALRLRAAWQGKYRMELGGVSPGLWNTLAIGLALTWLNPHVYLDTLGLIGAVSTQYAIPGSRLAFAIGAATSSFVFFFGLGYGARLLAPVMTSARAWRVLDILIGLAMWAIGAGLLGAFWGRGA